MPSPFTTDMESASQYSSCETLDSHRSSECDEKSEVNGNAQHKKARKISAEHTDYIVKERVTRKEPPKPVNNPMQFVAIKPSNLYHTAQEQLKKAEEIKKVQKESTAARKEEPEDWQNNLDNWKSSRRKRVEHIIDRVVEVKKLEEEEHDRNRRSIKTFSELMEERGSRRKLSALAIYTEEDATIDMSDLTPMSDESSSSDKMKTNSDNNSDKKKQASDTTDDVFNNNNNNSSNHSNGNNFHSTALIKDVIHKKQEVYTAAAAAPLKVTMPKHYEDETKVKTEVEERITTDLSGSEDAYKMTMSAKVTTTTSMSATKTALRSLDARERDYTYDDAIEDYKTRVSQATKLDLPKIDINKKRELFEQQHSREDENSNISTVAAKLGTEIVSIKERISSLRNNLVTNGTASTSTVSSFASAPPKKVDLEVSATIKDRLSSLHQQVSSPIDEASKRMLDTPFKNVHEARNEFELKQQQHLQPQTSVSASFNARVSEVASLVEANENDEAHELSTDHEDSDVGEHYLIPPPDVIQHEQLIMPMTTSAASENLHDEINEEDSSDCIEEALDLAFQLIDNENVDSMPNAGRHLTTMTCRNAAGDFNVNKSIKEPIYENVADDDDVVIASAHDNVSDEYDDDERAMKKYDNKIDLEPHYQVPRSREPYYETPKKSVPIPLYENVELMFPASSDSSRFSMAESNESFGIDDGTEMIFPISTLVPPKEKPPPLPELMDESSQLQGDNFKRINSTKRIKKEIRNKRSSFLGIEGQAYDDNLVELTVPPPPNMQAFLQEEKRYERQLYQKSGFYENAINGESRDSGLDNHSRQSSEPSSAASSEGHTEIDGGGMLLSEQRGNFTSYNVNEDDNRIKTLEEQISQQENYSNYRHHQHDDSFDDDDHQEVLRVEQLLLQIEQQELKRQRDKLMLHKNIARRELDEGVKMLMTNNNNNNNSDMASASLQDLNVSNGTSALTNGGVAYENNVSYRHNHNRPQHQHNHINEYRKSMPNLQELSHVGAPWNHQGGLAEYQQHYGNESNYQFGDLATSSRSEMHLHAPTPYQPPPPPPMSSSATHIHRTNNVDQNNIYGNMTRNALMQISAVPKPKLTNEWIQYRKSEPSKSSLNSHWLIQEAEQRRIDQLNNARTASANSKRKPLPDAVIHSIQQRIVDLGIGSNVNKRYTVFDSKQMPQIAQTHAPLLMMSQPPTAMSNMSNMASPSSTTAANNGGIMHNPLSIQQQQHPHMPPQQQQQQQLEILSVSSKKLCSYCAHELGSGAAMIIENLGLFYHIDCFKCSVCHTPIADGTDVRGTDVRVRNSRLHCANCFSNEEGIKFSCV